MDERQLFLTALITADDPPPLVQCPLCSLVVLLHERLEEVEDGDAFTRMFRSLLPTVEIRLILYNVESLLAVLHRTGDGYRRERRQITPFQIYISNIF
jgi:hypothetical protein